MGRDKFKNGLEALGYAVELRDPDKVIVAYTVADGRFAGQQIKLGVQVPQDFEMTPPGGIHISPRLIPINPNPQNHSRAAESAPFGPEWEYLSRPFLGKWALKRTVKRYMEYVADLLNTL
jgi:hypothetical protein